MRKSLCLRSNVFLVGALVAVLSGGGIPRLAAQQTTATIIGTATDSSGASIPGAVIQAKNVGTGSVQNTQSDAQGRFRIADLPVGDYDVQASKDGFATVVRRGLSLAVGSENVVDFALAVGQTQQTVIVDAQVSQVQTATSTVDSLVNQTQMRELPLNGRDFEQLIQLAPGVQNYYPGSQATSTGTGANMREGRDPAISIAGSRPEGQLLLMDDQNLETFYNRGLGSVTGTSLGVDSISEFQEVTNTYGAQFGGAGAVMNAVSKSGNNAFHGSAYEFIRNSDLDARNFTDPSSVPEFRRNQYGATIGGPIIKNKLFFFLNYEGIDYVQGVSSVATVPLARTSTSTNPLIASAVDGVLALYPAPQFNINKNAGTGQARVTENNTAFENYGLGRIDYNISDKDSFLARYFLDLQHAVYPFSGGPVGLWPELDAEHNQFATMEWRHIISTTMVNLLRDSFSRTEVVGNATEFHPALQFFPGSGRPDGTIAINGLTTIGTGGASPQPEGQLQNRFSEGDDIYWTRGAHSLRFGFSIDRVQSYALWPFESGSSWTFNSIPLFLAGQGLNVSGTTNTPNNNPVRNFREIDYAMYAQDDWKVSSKLTVNLGLRYEPTNNPSEVHNLLYAVTNFNSTQGFVNVPNTYQANPSLKNIDPRAGFAYDVFGDHKTSIRGGFGTFHDVIYAGEYVIYYINSPPWNVITQQNPTFPTPFTGSTAPNITITNGFDWKADKTPYLMEYNLNIQRDLGDGMVLTVGYVGSHGINELTEQEQNPVSATITNGVYVFSPSCGPTSTIGPKVCPKGDSGRTNTSLGSFQVGENGSTIRYNSLQATLNRRLTQNIQAQVAYTYSKCMSDGDAALASLSGNAPTAYENPYDRGYDQSLCAYNATQALRVNALGTLPFKANRFVSGWQITSILAVSTGLPFNVTDGVDQSNQINTTPRPNYSPNNPAATVGGISYPACNNNPIIGTAAMYFNPNCFTPEPFGTLGNFGREGLTGPGLVNMDVGFLKTTKIRENMTLQFRAELFNIFNHTNLSEPVPTLFTGAIGPNDNLNRLSTSGQITTYAAPSREIQFGLKLIF